MATMRGRVAAFGAGALLVLLATRGSLTGPLEKKQAPYLAVAALYEEDAAFCEWIEHYVMEGCDKVYVGTVGQPSEVAMANIRRYRSRVVHLPLDEDRGTIEDNTAAFLENVREVATEDHVEWVVVAQMDDFVTTRKYNDDRLADTLTIYETNSVAVVYFPWLMFGSSELEDTPASVVSSFTNRMNMSQHLRRVCTSCLCNSTSQPRHGFGDGYIAKPAFVETLGQFVAVPRSKNLAVSSVWDPLETNFVAGPDGTERMHGYRGWVWTPRDHTIVSHKYFYQAREHWVRVKCAGISADRALVSFAAGNSIANTNRDETLKVKRDSRMKLLHPNGARLLMDTGRRCLSWQTHPVNTDPVQTDL